MFERDKTSNEIKSFDIDLSSSSNKEPENNNKKDINKKALLAGLAAIFLIGGGFFAYYVIKSNNQQSIEVVDDNKIMFLPIDDITVNLRQGIENSNAWLKVKITLEVRGKNNYDSASKMMPKIIDVFQTYLKELRKSDLEGSFGIYKIKDEMMLRINAILYPSRIEAILFQDFIMQVL